jgi:3-dehydroquinate synthase II
MREILVFEPLPPGPLPPCVRAIPAGEPVVEIRGKEDEAKAVALGLKSGRVLVKCSDWLVIPLENLVAQCKGKAKLVGVVKDAEEARLALQALELGVDAVLLENPTAEGLFRVAEALDGMEGSRVELTPAKVVSVKRLGMGARSCIDTCSLMGPGEGMLVGSSSSGMLLVQSECEENALAAPRPFRVNAGAISLYAMAPGNRTRYVQELRAGDEVLTVTREGKAGKSFVARSKVELRPLLLVEAEQGGRVAKAVLQDAETVRLVTPGGSASVSALKPGDEVLAVFSEGGRHFGTHVKGETVIEK